ncbi:hypothetical protein D9M70_461530 [compost metagenome]
MANGYLFCQADAEHGFPGAGPTSNDHEVSRAQPVDDAVQILQTEFQTADRTPVESIVHLVDHRSKCLGERDDIWRLVDGAELHHQLLRLGVLVLDAAALHRQVHDAPANLVHPAGVGSLTDDLGVLHAVRRTRHVPHDLRGVDDGQLAAGEFCADLREGDRIGMGLLRVAAEDHGIQGAVVRIAEVLDGEEGANGFALLRLVHQGA